MAHIHGHGTPCEAVLIQLSDLADDALRPDVRHDLEQHLDGCPNCRLVYDTLTETIRLYRKLGAAPVELPAPIEQRLLRCLNVPTQSNSGSVF